VSIAGRSRVGEIVVKSIHAALRLCAVAPENGRPGDFEPRQHRSLHRLALAFSSSARETGPLTSSGTQ